jgi:hypothetical protein
VVRTANTAVEIFFSSDIIDQPGNAVDISWIMKPIPPIASTPRKHIFIESQSSVLPGFVASFSNLDAD